VGLINKAVPHEKLLEETLAWCERIKGHSAQTIRATKKSLNHESDTLYASWQQGMELLAHIWGSPEAMEGMQALGKRKPNFMQFRQANKKALDKYLDDFANDRNERSPGAS
jgi:1,4-dihydroxy-2-naphthoyl-CoA synthase